jgi:hypothetical protein
MTSRDWASFPLNIGEDMDGSRNLDQVEGHRDLTQRHLPVRRAGGRLQWRFGYQRNIIQRRCSNSFR